MNKFFQKIVLNGLDIFCKDNEARERLTLAEGSLNDAKDDIENLDGRVTALEGGGGGGGDSNRFTNIVFLGDSYAVPDTGWIDIVANTLSLVQGETYYKFARGSTSFGYNGGRPSNAASGLNFCDLLNYAVNNMTEAQREAVTDIIIGGGANDYGDSTSAINVGIISFVGIAGNNFPNAKIHCYITGWVTNPDYRAAYFTNYMEYLESFAGRDCECRKVFYPLIDKRMRQADGIHPNEYGNSALAGNILACMNGGEVSYPIGAFNDNASSPKPVKCCFPGADVATISLISSEVAFSSAVTIDSTYRKLFDITNNVITGEVSSKFGVSFSSVLVHSGPTAEIANVEVAIKYVDGRTELWGKTNDRNADGSRKSYTGVVQMSIPNVNMSIPVYYI